jgi:hypothetical protein
MTDSYVTNPAAVIVPRAVRLGSVWITQHPVEDPAGPGLAHLTYAGALEVAAAHGARLPTREEVLELHQVAAAAGAELVPVILPDAELRAQGCVPGDPAMASRAWCDRHDSRVLEHIVAIDADVPVANAGKHWIGPAPAGKAALCGWWMGGIMIQSGLGFPHNDQHHDYGTTTMLVWGAEHHDTDPAPAPGA